jgi:hypothetical protein
MHKPWHSSSIKCIANESLMKRDLKVQQDGHTSTVSCAPFRRDFVHWMCVLWKVQIQSIAAVCRVVFLGLLSSHHHMRQPRHSSSSSSSSSKNACSLMKRDLKVQQVVHICIVAGAPFLQGLCALDVCALGCSCSWALLLSYDSTQTIQDSSTSDMQPTTITRSLTIILHCTVLNPNHNRQAPLASTKETKASK